MIKITSIIIILLASYMTSISQSVKKNIYDIYVSGKILEWKPYLNQKAQTTKQKTEVLKLQYAYIGWCIGNDKKDEAKRVLKTAENIVDFLLGIYPKDADLNALKGAFYGYKIALKPLTAVRYGPKSLEYIDSALAYNKNSAQAWLEKANASYYAPLMFGGDKTAAMQYYEKALDLMKKANKKHDWLYLNTMALTGKAYFDIDEKQKAILLYKAALKIEPDFHWINSTLLPEAESK